MSDLIGTSIFFGALTDLCWGASNPLLTWASRSLGSLRTTLLVHLVGGGILALLALWNPTGTFLPANLSAEEMMTASVAGCLLGVLSALATLLAVQGFKYGPLSLVSPVLATDGMLASILALILFAEHLTLFGGCLLATTGCGLILASIQSGERPTHQHRRAPSHLLTPGVLFALLAATLFALMQVGMGAVSKQTTGTWMIGLLALRLSSVIMLLSVCCFSNPSRTVQTEGTEVARKGSVWPSGIAGWGSAFGAGVADGISQVFFVLGTAAVASITMSVAAAMTILVPVLLGLTLFGEKLVGSQRIGVLLLLSGVPAFALPAFFTLLVLVLQTYVLCLWIGETLRHRLQRGRTPDEDEALFAREQAASRPQPFSGQIMWKGKNQ